MSNGLLAKIQSVVYTIVLLCDTTPAKVANK